MKKGTPAFQKYNELVHPQRVNFLLSRGINFFMGERDRRQLHAFLIVWTAFSIKMTEKVEDWINRSGEKCEVQSFAEVGIKLRQHATQEAGHDLMLVDDLKILLSKWNAIYKDELTVDDVIKISLPANTEAYVAMHENAIQSEHPYTQVAIEYEIERISVLYGAKIIENIIYSLGEDFEEGISFLTDHVLLDQGHTKFNMILMEKCFTAQGSLAELAKTGTTALRIYSGFLNECVEQSHTIAKRVHRGNRL